MAGFNSILCLLLVSSLCVQSASGRRQTGGSNNRGGRNNGNRNGNGNRGSGNNGNGNGNGNGSQKKPNIVFIMADDLGWNDVGFHNNKVRTPNLNKLARSGLELTSNYMQPICSPSRSALMTGKYPSNNGMQHLVLIAESPSCLPVEHKTIHEYMKQEGYVTNYVGKWHLGLCNRQCLPESRGIDVYRGILGGECGYLDWSHNGVVQRYVNGEDSVAGIGQHLLLRDTEDVKELIAAHRGKRKPLFMMISPTAPHVPLEPTEKMFNAHNFLSAANETTRARRQLLGLVSGLDDLVGETVKALKQAKMDKNTIIVFMSDNGGANIEPFFPGFPSHGNNYPLRNGKYSSFEGGVRVPTLYYDPRLPASTRGKKRNFLMHVTDWLPTFLSLAGSKRKVKRIDGVSQIRNLQARYSPNDQYKVRSEALVVLTKIANQDFECGDRDSAYRWKDWKIIHATEVSFSNPDEVDEYVKPAESPELPTLVGDSCSRIVNGERVYRCLFNIKDDPSELTNLYDRRPDIVEIMLDKIEQARAGVVIPAYSDSEGVNDQTTRPLSGFIVSRHDYCTPATDFPLLLNDPTCDGQ